MPQYIDGYIFPIRKGHVEAYKQVAEKIADIWKKHGALAYSEYVTKGPQMEGTRAFSECLAIDEGETIIFGWIVFNSQEERDQAHQKVATDSRMEALVAPLLDPERMIFDAQRMIFGGFERLIEY